jgi:hypothetical protein
MADLFIDGPMLERVKSNFKHIEDLLNGPAKTMKNVDGTNMGPAKLRERLQDFGEEWGYGIDQLGEFSASAVDALQNIADAFGEADTNLADALENAGKEK